MPKGRTITDPEELAALKAVQARLAHIPTTTTLTLHVWREGDPPPPHVVREFRSGQTVRFETLRAFRERLGGDTGELSDHQGNRYPASVAEWADADPDTTFVFPSYTREPEAAYREEWTAIWAEHFAQYPPGE